ncbi:amidohydrolase 2 [Pseudomonas sp. CFII64]|uniref:amidohydrolase family protein n=1 Tax=Pseudomonas sp. CFII64 TaxID=911242 RepID=UPI000357C8AF|nr:amidohydrolase family protein [Pseudomonas sp. CFII64]EPJ79993.1 amidohydrolase 2 [Pseudomonas sp. CFII64]
MSESALSPMPGACDCHVHIYEPERFTLTQRIARASWSDYQQVQRRLGLERALLVQANGYGFDMGCLLDALAQAGDAARGIAVIAPDTSDETLARLHRAGVRGVRFMLIPDAQGALGWDALEPISARIAELGWVINLQVDGRQLPDFEARIRALPSLVSIDHTGKFLEPVGIDHTGFKSLLSLLDSGKVWVKVSAPYETSKSGPPHYQDVSVLARTLVQAFPERCLWASNWPHPGRSPAPDDLAMLDLLSEWALDDSVRRRILVDNPARLYGFKPV